MNSVYTYWVIILLILLSISETKAQVRISVTGYTITSNFTDFTNSYVTLNSQLLDLNEPVNLVFYDGRYTDENKILMKSEEFNLTSGLTKLSISEILENSRIPSNLRKSRFITIVLAHFNSGVQKGITTITTLNNSNAKKNSGTSGLINLDGEITAVANRANGSLDTFSNNSLNNLELHTKVEIGSIPMYVDALAADYNDPFEQNRNPSYFSFNFLADEWKEKQRSKINEGIEKEVNEIYPISNDMKLAANKYEYLNKVYQSKSFADDFEKLKSQYLPLIDSVGSIDKFRSIIKNKEKEAYELIADHSLSAENANILIDSLKNIHSSVERLNKYNQLIEHRDSCARIKKSVEDKLGQISNYKNSIYAQPAEINKRLDNLKSGNTIDKALNYVDIFRIGLISPRFSKYSLVTSQNKGVHVGLNFGYLSVESFFSKSLERSSALNSLNEIGINNYFGNKFSIRYNELLSNSFFYISKIDGGTNPDDNVNSQIGYTLDYSREDKTLVFESVFSRLETENDEIENSFVDIFSNAAIDLTYTQKGDPFNYNWTTNVKFLGKDFADFNNPFLFNNNLSINSRISLSLIRELRTSIHTNFQESNLQQETSALNRRGTIGSTNTFVKQGWPVLTHTYQYGFMNISGQKVVTHLQNVSGQFNTSLLNLQLNSNVLFSWNRNIAEADSLSSSFKSISLSNTLELSKVYAFNLIGDYSYLNQSSEDDYKILSLELSPSIDLNNFNMNFGMKYLYDRNENRLGWLIRLNYNIGQNINLSLDLDNSIFERYINETGEIKDNFYERYSGTLNYKF